MRKKDEFLESFEHVCVQEFKKVPIDECSDLGSNICYGDRYLTLEVWHQDYSANEWFFDNWVVIGVNYCPFCGYSPKENNEEPST